MTEIRTEDEAAIHAVLADSYDAWAAGDADAMVANYTDDATAIMVGSLRDSRTVIRDSMAEGFAGPLKGTSTYNKRLGQPGFAAYQRVDGVFRLHTLQIFTVGLDGISRNSVFLDQEIFDAFGLLPALDDSRT